MELRKDSTLVRYLIGLRQLLYTESRDYSLMRLPTNVCNLFWYIIGQTLLALVFCIGIVMTVGLVLFLLTGVALYPFYPLIPNFQLFDYSVSNAVAVGMVWLLIGTIILLATHQHVKETRGTKSPGVVGQYIADKKENFCSTVVYVDGDENETA